MRTLPMAAFVIVFCVASVVAHGADPLRYRLTVEAGDVERMISPTLMRLEVGKDVTEAEAAALAAPVQVTLTNVTAGGRRVPAQAQWELREDGKAGWLVVGFYVGGLKAGQTAQYELTLGGGAAAAAAAAGAAFRFAEGDGFRELLLGDRPVYRHEIKYDPANHEATYKPFHHVYGFGADAGFITKGQGGQYTHHRGLYVGWNKTGVGGDKTYDFWHCPDVAQRHEGYVKELESVGPVFARAVSKTNWTDPQGQPVVTDLRDVTAWNLGDAITALDWRITISPAGGAPVKLDGDPQHAGFQFRAAEEVQQGKATYIRPATAKDTGNDVWADCNWAAARFTVKGKPYVVVHMDAPENPRPVVYSTRDYGRFGSFYTTPPEVKEPLTLRYRVAVLDGEKFKDVDAEDIERAYKDFATPVKVTAERVKQ